MLFDPNATDDEIFEDLRMMPTLILHMNLEEMSAGLLSKIADLIIFDPTYINLIKNHLKGSSQKIFQILVQYNLKMIKYLDDFCHEEFSQDEIYLSQLFKLLKPKLSEEISLWKYIPSKFYKSAQIAQVLKEMYMSNPENLKVFHQTFIDLRDDLEIAHWALSYDPYHFICLSLALKDNEALLMKAIENNIFLFKYASIRLKKNPTLFLDIVRKYNVQDDLSYKQKADLENMLITLLPLSLQQDNEFMITLFQILSNHEIISFNWHFALQTWPLDYPTLFKDPVARKIIIQYYPKIILNTMLDEIKDNRDFFIDLFSVRHLGSDTLYLQYASKEIKNDKQIALLAIKSNSLNFKYIPSHLRNDIDVLFTLVSRIYNKYELEELLTNVSKKSLKNPKIIKILAERFPTYPISFSRLENRIQRKIVKYRK